MLFRSAQLAELITHRDGATQATQLTLGRVSYDQVTLVRGIGQDDAFAVWAKAVRAAGTTPPRKDVRIEVYDRERRRMTAWRLLGALPVKYDAPDLNAGGTDVPSEELVLAYERLELG